MSPVLAAILVTLKLAGLTTLILLLLGMPLAWWLARTRWRWRIPIGALVALPMVLPPTVLGFYLLLGMGPTGPLGRFTSVVLPLSRPALVTAALFGFAHTVGEFGVVLMVGGNIDGQTRVLSVLLYDQFEAMAYSDAHRLAAGLLMFSFGMLLVMQWLGRRTAIAHD